MLLDNKNRSLKVTLATAIGTGKVACMVHHIDAYIEKQIPVAVLTQLVAGVNVICTAPPDQTAREILELNITNTDNATHDVTITLFDGATGYDLKFQAALPIGKTIHYNHNIGWILV